MKHALLNNRFSVINIHFTISAAHQPKFEALIKDKLAAIEDKFGCKFNISFSQQLHSTDTVAVNEDNSAFRLDDGSMLFVTKFGRMIKSESGLLGPYKVLTDTVNQNSSIPSRYRQSNYEDPVMWKDDVQYHQIINAFLDYRAIYLRSGDGINWKFDTGLAYTPQSTRYENGHETKWYKLERPHVIQDQHKRATHLSLAVIDTVKRQDFANDAHSAKNIIIPLTKHKRLTLLSPLTDINLDSLRYGASEAVNFGRGSRLLNTEIHKEGLVLSFSGSDSELSANNFASKLLGKTHSGELVVGFTKR